MRHTQLTARNYAGFASVMLILGFATTGLGAVDLAMIAPKGVDHVAAVGQGDLIVVGIYAFFLGIVEAFSSRLAVAEGEGATARRLPLLTGALLLMIVLCQVLAIGIAVIIEPTLTLFGQNTDIVSLIDDYVWVRMCGAAPVILYFGLNEALKICGARNLSLVILLIGFGINTVLNWVFLYTGGQQWFSSPESAVAASTVLAQLSMSGCAVWMFTMRMRARNDKWIYPNWRAVNGEFRKLLRTAPGVGTRHLNDYAGSIVPVMFIGTMDVEVLAAALVATKIYTLFCRVPQACFEANFVFYGYALGRPHVDKSATVQKLRNYAGTPTAIAAILVLLTMPWMVDAFASPSMNQSHAQLLVVAYLIYLPAYFVEQMMGRMLTVHQKGALLFTASTALTYGATIPLAWISVFIFDSAFLAIIGKGLATAILAFAYWRAFRAATGNLVEARSA